MLLVLLNKSVRLCRLNGYTSSRTIKKVRFARKLHSFTYFFTNTRTVMDLILIDFHYKHPTILLLRYKS